MRGVVPLIAITMIVGLAAPVVAAEDQGAIDLKERSLDVQDLLSYGSFELLLLPDHILDQAGAPLDTELPEANQPLQPDLQLLRFRTTDLALPFQIGDIDPLGPKTTADGSSGTLQSGDGTGVSAVAASSTTGDQTTGDAATSPSTAGSTADARTTTSTQAAATSSSPSTVDSVKDAWQSLSDGEKAALTAGAVALMLLGPLTMYSRISRDETLENDTRREIYDIVESTPGICIKDVADAADVSYSTASYHLDRLVKTDYLVKDQEGNKVLYYKNGGTFTKDERELVPILKNHECMRVFEHILENPWCYRAEAAEALGVSHTTVNWHLKRLTDAGLVDEHREGRNCHLYIDDQALNRVMAVMDKLEAMAGDEELPMQEPAAAEAVAV